MTETSQSARISADVKLNAPPAAETDAIGHQLPSPSGNPDGPEARPTHSTPPRVTDLGHEAALASAPHGGPTSAGFAWVPQLGKAVREDYFVDPPAPSASKVRFRPAYLGCGPVRPGFAARIAVLGTLMPTSK